MKLACCRVLACAALLLAAGELRADDNSPDEVLLASGPPSLLETVRLVRQFSQRDAALREAAIRRLLPYPREAGTAVLKALREGDLSSKLAAYELLAEWKAPIDDLDPWRPETLSDERFQALDAWHEQRSDGQPPAEAAQTDAATLTDQQLAAARDDLARLQKAETPDEEAAAIRERLARFGKPLLPEVYHRLRQASTDDERQRLLALRYRLVAPDALTLTWPGGLERLAASQSQVRHQAADELARMGQAELQPLLLEMFSDPDPLVRELSLRGLKNVGGPRAVGALADLLKDPEPNVRAAVLKQLAEDATAEMAAYVATYMASETDPDLLVHAVRFFRELKDNSALHHVLPLLNHESWQVRAEAAEVIGMGMEVRLFVDDAEHLPDIYDRLLESLDDEEAFVVYRVVEALRYVNVPRAVPPLVKAAERHPQLASAIVRLLAAGSAMREQAIGPLREFFQHEQPAVRAAAVAGLARTAPKEVQADLAAAFNDPASEVRIAAAEAVITILRRLRDGKNSADTIGRIGRFSPDPFIAPPAPTVAPPAPAVAPPRVDDAEPAASEAPAGEESADAEPVDDVQIVDARQDQLVISETDPFADEDPPGLDEEQQDRWLRELYGGKHRPPWMATVVAPLQEMLSADGADERLAAAVALIPLGQQQMALPVLRAAAEQSHDLLPKAARAFRWLPANERSTLFTDLVALAPDAAGYQALIHPLVELKSPQTAELFWPLLETLEAKPELSSDLANVVEDGLRQAYFGTRYYSPSSVNERQRKQIAEQVEPKAQSGSYWQRIVALVLLHHAAPEAAASFAEKLVHDEAEDERLRRDALHVMLVSQTAGQRAKTAIELLSSPDPERRRTALKLLALGTGTLTQLPASGLSLTGVIDAGGPYHFSSSGQPIIPPAPPQLKPEHVRPSMADSDEESAAYAGYLLVLLNDPAGLEPLLRYWREAEESRYEWDWLVYRAIAVADDPRHVPVLREIYARLDEHYRNNFYWTIRIMSGPEILQFRQQIRDEVGMENLR